MTEELIKRLRSLKWMVNCEMRGMIPDTTAYEAADELDRLRSELERCRMANAVSEAKAVKLRDELRQIYVDATEQHADWCNMGPVDDEARDWAFGISTYARQALKDTDHDQG